jgi:peptide/nickel transport system ATP-binding protein
MNDPLLEIKDLYVNFDVYGGTLKVLNGLDLTIAKKEKVGLIGEAGCGKTTTMKSILRILANNARIPQGEILINGKDILKLNRGELQTIRRKSISMIFQDPTAALNPVFKIGTQLSDAIKYSLIAEGKSASKSEIKSRAIQILEEVALPDPKRMLENYPFQLSGGMRQRVCIAMAMVAAHELLIADEPGTSLDVTIEDQILKLIDKIVEEKGISIILISHALGAVKGLVDKVYVMYAGSIVEEAETRELFSNPLHPYTQSLINAIPKITGGGIPEPIKGRIVSYLTPPKGCRFFPRCELSTGKAPPPCCRNNTPKLLDVGKNKNHRVACYTYGE